MVPPDDEQHPRAKAPFTATAIGVEESSRRYIAPSPRKKPFGFTRQMGRAQSPDRAVDPKRQEPALVRER
jgi:hypothetical protein